MESNIIRIHKRECPYVAIDKAALEDSRLSFKARGLLAHLLSKPNNWVVRVADLASRGPDGRDSILAGLKELEKTGYLVRRKLRDPQGRIIGTETVVFEQPQVSEPETAFPVTAFPVVATPETDYPDTGFPDTANPLLEINDLRKKEFREKTQNTSAVASLVCGELFKLEQNEPEVSVPEYVTRRDLELWVRFERLWQEANADYRGDKKPAWVAFKKLRLPPELVERIQEHLKTWDARLVSASRGETGFVPAHKHLQGYLAHRQFDSPVPVPRQRSSGDGTAIAVASPPVGPSPEALRVAELKRLGIVAIDLLNGRAELEDRYADAIDVVGTVRYAQILAHEETLRSLHARTLAQYR